MSSTWLRGKTTRRVAVVGASALSVGLLATIAPTPVTVAASAEVSTSTSTAALAAGQVTAQSLSPVIAAATTTSTTSRLASTSRSVTRAPAVAPFAFGTRAYNQWWARYYMVNRYKWKNLSQFRCLVALWQRESSWNHRAHNRRSGAYGIPQALPGRKMSTAGPNWRNNPQTQIKWGLGYIKNRYGTPCGAWSAFQRKGWY